jgi:tetratricopeptide (TPR) repeat protein
VATAVAALLMAVVLLALSTALVWRENQAKKKALASAGQGQKAAEKAQDKAMGTVQRMLARVLGKGMAANPQMKEVRRKQMEDAAGFYMEMIALNPEDARAYHELARLLATLEKSIELHEGGNGFDWFFLALAHWRLGDREQARAWYDKAVAWMDKNKPEDGELKRYRAEAAELLGVKDPPARKEAATPKP